MEIKQRKVCGSCRAYSGGTRMNCALGYPVDYGKVLMGVIVDGIPTEPCPKPLTYSDYMEASKNYRKA